MTPPKHVLRAVEDEQALQYVRRDPWYGAPWSKSYEPDIASAARRTLEVGATPPLDYKGIGMTGVVFCDAEGTGYKAARAPEAPISRKLIEEEAKWLSVASTVPGVREHVARFKRYHPEQVVIERECINERDRQRRSGDDTRKFELHKQIGQLMSAYGFSAPEYKEDSYRWHPGRGWVLVDASMPILKGARLVAHAVEILQGRRFYNESPSSVAFALRSEAGRTVDAERAKRLSDRLLALPDADVYPKS